jgi:hypothetical protein
MRDIIIRLQEKHKIELIRSYICPVRSVDQTFTQTFLNIIIQLPEKQVTHMILQLSSRCSILLSDRLCRLKKSAVSSSVGKDEENDRDRRLLPWLHEPHQPAHLHVGLLQPWVIIATSASMQWYMSLTDAIAPCFPVHRQQQPKQGHMVLFAGT